MGSLFSLLLPLLLLAAALFWWHPELRERLFGLGAQLVFRVEGGRVETRRGSPPSDLLSDLRLIVASEPTLQGRVEISGHGEDLRVEAPGLPEGVTQRIRNVVMMRRRDL